MVNTKCVRFPGMSPRRADDEFVGMQKIAELLEVEYGTVRHWRSTRKVLPAPEIEHPSPLWRRSVIEKWAKATGRLKREDETS